MSFSPCLHSCPLQHGEVAGEGPARAVFLDRDGVLIEDTGYLDDPDLIRLRGGTGEGLRSLRTAGWRLIVVTNQAGVARGRFTLERLDEIHARLRQVLAGEEVRLDALYFCPHHAEGTVPPFNVPCSHRKPEPGMLLSAAARLQLRLSECWMIGDKESDVAAAHAAGCRAILIGSGNTAAEAAASTLLEAAGILLGSSPRVPERRFRARYSG